MLSRVISAGTALSGTCTVASTTFSLRRVKHHGDPLDAAQVREQIGVALPRQPCLREGELVDGRGRDRIDVAALRGIHRAISVS